MRWGNVISLQGSAELLPWLVHPGSFTERLQQHTQQSVTVTVLCHHHAIPTYSERQYLGMSKPCYALIREVHLCVNKRPRQYARTVIPLSSLQGKYLRLKRWGAVPLGRFLFADPHIIREPFQITQLDKNDFYYPRATQHLFKKPVRLWARRSIFRLKNKPLLISEVFLPGDWNDK